MTDGYLSRPDDQAEETRIDFRASLNPAQYEAVTTLDGPMLVVAGAGSGKTRTLVYRVAYLVQQGVPPETILLLTFTRKAAAEMLTRAEALVGDRCARVSGGTFHSLAHEILRHWSDRIGFPNSFGVMDRGDMEEVLSHLRKGLDLREKDRKFPKRGTLATVISKAANKGLSLERLVIDEYIHLKDYLGDIKNLAAEYASYKQESALMDFDDLLLHLARLLSENAEARERIARRYQYIMVDEYQDTNKVQAEIVHLLGRDHKNVMVVGDDAQSIYSFRGASFRNIMDFPRLFPGARIIRLEENYRSRQPILSLTNHIISQAREKYEKKLFTRLKGGEKPKVLLLYSQKEQSLFVCDKIKELAAQGVDPSRMAVLFRASRDSFDLEVELLRHGLDYVKHGGRRFLESAHVKDLLSLLRAAVNPNDSLSLTRALLLFEGIGPKTAAKMITWVGGRRENLQALKDYPGQEKVKQALAPLADLLQETTLRGLGLQDRVERTWKTYRPIMEERYDDWPSRLADINEFLRLAGNYTNLVRFLSDMALDPPNSSASKGAVPVARRLTLSTVHSAKGLEWQVVFIIWAVEGRFPPMYALENPMDLDEERRLMYVAATRAKDHLFIICPLEADESRGFGGRLFSRPKPSRFLTDVPEELVSAQGAWGSNGASRPAAPVEVESGRPPVPPAYNSIPAAGGGGLRPGERVVHPVFGLGRVIKLLGQSKIKVDFDHFGLKTLHLDYAGLKKLEA
ncbi:MAG: UvrD-helicase domain-containing protein [Pseudomonadota bacterium]